MNKIMNAIEQINKIYGDTESMVGTYKHFLDIKHEAEYLEKKIKKLEKVIDILKDKTRPELIPSNGKYILRTNAWHYVLTQQEYELLKEVLENDK